MHNLINPNLEQLTHAQEAFTDDHRQQEALDILKTLSDRGIKRYMKEYLAGSKHIETIESIFNDIILNHFVPKYQNRITYFGNENFGVSTKTVSYME